MLTAASLTVGALIFSLRRRERTWVDGLPAYLFFVALALARHLTGGTQSGLAALLALPILWVALTGTRIQLWVVSVLTPLLFIIPVLLVGPPLYDVVDWRRAVGWTAFAVFVAPVIQRIVWQLGRETHRAREASAEMDGIARGAHLTSIITTELDGTIRSFSVGAEDLLGHRAQDLVGLADLQLFHDPVEIAEVALELGVRPGVPVFAALAQAAATSRTWTYLRADGSRAFVRLVFTELHDPEGRVNGFLCVGLDNTPAVEAKRALTLSEARWRVLMENLPDTTAVVVDEDHRIRLIAGAGAVGRGMRGTEGRLLSEVSSAGNYAILAQLVDRALGGEEVTGELAMTSTNAEHEVAVTRLPDDNVDERVLILARDVSADRSRERAVVRAKQRAERLFADAPHGVAVLTTDGTVVQANAAMLALLGATHAELIGRPFATISSSDDDDPGSYLDRVLSSPGASVETEWTLRNFLGDHVHVVLSGRVLAEDGFDDTVLLNVVDVSERKRYETRLGHLADHDALTGLANRRRFERELESHLDRCRRYGPTGALLLLDLDHFKDVNDTLGHAAGDELIVSTARLLRGGLRTNDLVARLGGDEFAILLTEGDRTAAESVAASIVQRVREHTSTLDGIRRRVTASVGAVTLQAASGHPYDLLALADMTMYDAKEAGRNRYAILDEDGVRAPRSGTRLQWKSRIELALETDGFVLHLQPIQDLRTGHIHSAEALLRMTDEGGELVPPAQFLPIAERAGLMPALDNWVIGHAVGMLARLRNLDPQFQLEVNLSGLSIGDPQTEQVIIDSLRRHSVDPAALILEITETTAVADVQVAREFAERMTALGCKFALDDFGAGFGSFYYLKHLLFDYVKIDGEFVTNCHRSDGRPNDPALDRRDRPRSRQADRGGVRDRAGSARDRSRRGCGPRPGLPGRRARAVRRVRGPLRRPIGRPSGQCHQSRSHPRRRRYRTPRDRRAYRWVGSSAPWARSSSARHYSALPCSSLPSPSATTRRAARRQRACSSACGTCSTTPTPPLRGWS